MLFYTLVSEKLLVLVGRHSGSTSYIEVLITPIVIDSLRTASCFAIRTLVFLSVNVPQSIAL